MPQPRSTRPYRPSPADLETVLALSRGGSLAAAGERLGVDASTVFRSLQRIERALGRPLFERTRSGYRAGELAVRLAEHAEHVESALEAAHSTLAATPGEVSGQVRITTTDAVLHAVVVPALPPLALRHPLLEFELHTGNELASLTRRDADLAVRATKRAPPHLVGRRVGGIRVALFAARKSPLRDMGGVERECVDWVAPDDALPEHPSVLWRRRHYPKVQPRYRVGSILAVAQFVALGLAVGVLPLFLTAGRADLRALTEPLEEAETDLWLLMHPEARHLRRVATVYQHLAEAMKLP